jgi:hypothetical protein
MLSGGGDNGSAATEALVSAYYGWFDPSSAHLVGLRSVCIYEDRLCYKHHHGLQAMSGACGVPPLLPATLWQAVASLLALGMPPIVT